MKKLVLTALTVFITHCPLLAQYEYDTKTLRYFRDYIETGNEFPRKPELEKFLLNLSTNKNARQVFANTLTEFHENRDFFSSVDEDSLHITFRVGNLNRVGLMYNLFLCDTTKLASVMYFWKGFSDCGTWMVPDSTSPLYARDSDAVFNMQTQQIIDFLREGISPPSCLTNRFEYNLAINNRYEVFKERIKAEGFRITERDGKLSLCFDKTKTYCYLKVDYCPYYFPPKEPVIYFLVQEY